MPPAAPTPARWRVVRFAHWLDPAFDTRLGREPGVDLAVAPIPASLDAAATALAGAHAYHVSSARDEIPAPAFVTAALLERCPELVFVSTYGAGYDSVDVAACTRAGVAVFNQAGANRQSVAEHTIGLMLAVTHRLAESDRRLRGDRTGLTREALMGREIGGRTLGLVGIGQIGSRVAELARAFGMEVLATDPYVEAAEVTRRGARAVGFERLLERSDFVSLHCPRDASTIGMMDAAAFARMKRGAVFISTARGGIHDEHALAAALASGHLAGAGLDVWQPEPPPAHHPLLALDNVVATYHTAGVTHEARRNIAVLGSEQLVHVLHGGRPPRLVNPDVWPAAEARYRAARERLGLAPAH